MTDSWVDQRLTLNVGARFDRYRVWLPEQSLPAGRFVPVALSFAEVSEVKVFNHIVPRIGASYDLLGDGNTVLKGNYGRFYFNPGVNLADSVNPNTANQYSDHVWNDLNNDRVFQEGEQGVLQTRFGGVANAAHRSEPRELPTPTKRRYSWNAPCCATSAFASDMSGRRTRTAGSR